VQSTYESIDCISQTSNLASSVVRSDEDAQAGLQYIPKSIGNGMEEYIWIMLKAYSVSLPTETLVWVPSNDPSVLRSWYVQCAPYSTSAPIQKAPIAVIIGL